MREKLRAVLDADQVVREGWQRALARDDEFNRLWRERTEWIEQQRAEKREALEALQQRHAQEQREHAARAEAERERHLREHEAARRLAEEFNRREAERAKGRDGPAPPGRAR